MQNNPYGIDFKSEIKKYKMLCRGKNTQCKNYLEWRTYILRQYRTKHLVIKEKIW